MADRVHILAVDDEQDIREILRILLESRGYAVACAASLMRKAEKLPLSSSTETMQPSRS